MYLQFDQDTAEKRKAFIAEYNKGIKAAKSIVIGGAGPVGVEVAADIKLRFKEKEVSLVHSTAGVLEAMPTQYSALAAQFLQKSGVHLILNTKVVDFTGREVSLSNGNKIPCDLYIPSFSGKPNTSFANTGIP